MKLLQLSAAFLFLAFSLAQLPEVESGLLSFVKSKVGGFVSKAKNIITQVSGFIKKVNPPAIPLPSPTKTKTISVEAARHFAQLASIAHCDGNGLENWTCTICNAKRPLVELIGVYSNETLQTLKYIAVDHGRSEIVVVSRGTRNLQNVIDDINIEQVQSPYKDGVAFHRGFYETTISLQEQTIPVLKELVSKYPTYTIVQAGHSLGGAIASISYYLLRHDPELRDKATMLLTFGEPRPGNRAFADFISSQETLTVGRIVNEGDVIPHLLPYGEGFFHHLTEIWTHKGKTRICRNDVYEDPACSNSLNIFQYLPSDHFKLLSVVSNTSTCST